MTEREGNADTPDNPGTADTDSTTGTDAHGEVGRDIGQDSGYEGETGAERRAGGEGETSGGALG